MRPVLSVPIESRSKPQNSPEGKISDARHNRCAYPDTDSDVPALSPPEDDGDEVESSGEEVSDTPCLAPSGVFRLVNSRFPTPAFMFHLSSHHRYGVQPSATSHARRPPRPPVGATSSPGAHFPRPAKAPRVGVPIFAASQREHLPATMRRVGHRTCERCLNN